MIGAPLQGKRAGTLGRRVRWQMGLEVCAMRWSGWKLAVGALAAWAAAAPGASAQFYRPDEAPRYEGRGYDEPRYGDPRYGREGYGREGYGRDGYGRDRYDQRPDERPDRYGRGYGGGGYGGGGRGGSYQQSCGEARQDGSTLTAVCRDGRGGQVQSSLDLNRCGRSDVANNAGFLQCGNVRARGQRVQ